MAFSQITAGQIETGDPITQELLQKIKDSFDDHEDRISDLEAVLQSHMPINFKVLGAASLYAPKNGVAYRRLYTNITLNSGRIFVPIAGSAGTVEIDVQYKRGGAAFATIFSARPTLAFGAGDYQVSSDGVLSVTELQAGDILRLDIVSAQTDCEEFDVDLGYTVT